MCSINIRIDHSDGRTETISKSIHNDSGDRSTVDVLQKLRLITKEAQSELNAALTVFVEKERAKALENNTTTDKTGEETGQDEEEEEEDDEDKIKNVDKIENGLVEPPEKVQKIS